MIKIITDSSALIGVQEGKQIGIEVIPLRVAIEGKTYRDFEEISAKDFCDKIAQGAIPTSSLPPIGEIIESYETYQEDEILSIHMAQGLSSTYEAALSARESVEHKQNIHVVNSKTLCGPQRQLVLEALKLVHSGKNMEEILGDLNQRIDSVISFLIPQDFGFLKRGGRLTPLAATLGGLLKIVPVVKQTPEGRLEKFATKRTYAKAVDAIISDLKKHIQDQEYQFFVSHAFNIEKVELVKKKLRETFENCSITQLDLSPAFITQGGPYCVAIQAMKK